MLNLVRRALGPREVLLSTHVHTEIREQFQYLTDKLLETGWLTVQPSIRKSSLAKPSPVQGSD